MKLIVGLGNPGKEYEDTRHNIGFRVVDLLAERWRIDMKSERFHAWFGSGQVRDRGVVLLKPTMFMNRSGRAVADAVRFYRIEAEDMVTIHDDIALDTGRLRLRTRGSSGGHKGLSDVIERLGSSDFCRLRIGVGRPPADATSYVLSPFGAHEAKEVERTIIRAADAVECWVTDGPVAVMNAFNAAP